MAIFGDESMNVLRYTRQSASQRVRVNLHESRAILHLWITH